MAFFASPEKDIPSLHINERKCSARDIAVVLLFSYLPVLQFVNTIIDKSTVYTDVFGREHWSRISNYSLGIQFLFFFAIGFLIFLEVLNEFRLNRSNSYSLVFSQGSFFSVLIIFVLGVINQVVLKDLVGILILGYFLAIRKIGIFSSWKSLFYIYIISLIPIILHVLLNWNNSWNECHGTKCGVFKPALLKSFFGNENVLGFYLAVGLSSAFVAKLKLRIGLLLLVTTMVVSTGSKISIVMIFLVGLTLIFGDKRAYKMYYQVPKISFGVSFLVFLFATGSALSGRGFIYDYIKSSFVSHPLTGQNRNRLQDAYFSGQSNFNFLASHEHNQIAFLVFEYGIVGLLLFTLIIFRMAKYQYAQNRFSSHLPLLVLTCGFATEELLIPSIFGWFTWAILLSYSFTEANSSIKYFVNHEKD